MRLVDADAILEKIDKEREYLIARGQIGAEHILVKYCRDFVEDAPTVENITVFCENADKKTIEELKAEMQKAQLAVFEGRPQGEWIFGSTLGHGWMKCSNCCVSQSEQTLCWSYCPNCGADMRKGGAT